MQQLKMLWSSQQQRTAENSGNYKNILVKKEEKKRRGKLRRKCIDKLYMDKRNKKHNLSFRGTVKQRDISRTQQ